MDVTNHNQNWKQIEHAFETNQQVKDFFKERGKEADFTKDDKGNYVDKETQAAFDMFRQDTSYNKETFSNALAEAAAFVGTGGTIAALAYGANRIGGNPIGKGITKLREGSLTGDSDPIGKSQSKTNNNSYNNHPKQSFNQNHSDSFSFNNGNYSIVPEAFQGELDSSKQSTQEMVDHMNNGGKIEDFVSDLAKQQAERKNKIEANADKIIQYDPIFRGLKLIRHQYRFIKPISCHFLCMKQFRYLWLLCKMH